MTADPRIESVSRFILLAHTHYGDRPFQVTSTHLASLIVATDCAYCGEPVDADDIFADLVARFDR
jgi:hypothetical protein